MRYYVFLLLLNFVFLSCKKTSIEHIEGDSFRISILPTKTEGFDNFKITGTLDVRNAANDVEYGLLVAKTINPTPENAIKYKIGSSRNSIDFIYQLSGLDTGAVYYVRAYGISNNKTEYS